MRVHPSPLTRPGAVQRVAPFAIGALLPLATIPLSPAAPQGHPGALAAGAALLVAIFVVGAVAPWRRLPASAQAAPALLAFLAIALLRDGSGASLSGFGPLVLLPVTWLALHGTRRELLAGIILVAVTFSAPIGLIGDPTYPVTEWRKAIVWGTLTPLVGFAIQDLARRLERGAVALRRSEVAFERVFERSPIGMGVIEPAGRILRAND